VTLDEFVGSLLSGITRGRAQSDNTSAQVAEQYAQHELLKGFPIPRMTIGNMEIEATFAIAPKGGSAAPLADAEIQKAALYRLRELVAELPHEPELAPVFQAHPSARSSWHAGLEGVVTRLGQVLSGPAPDLENVVNSLGVTLLNYVYECAPEEQRRLLFASRPNVTKDESSGKPAEPSSKLIERLLRTRVKALLGSTIPEQAGAATAQGLSVIVTSNELAQLNPASFQKVKFTLTSSDRRWVSLEKDGTKVNVLDRA